MTDPTNPGAPDSSNPGSSNPASYPPAPPAPAAAPYSTPGAATDEDPGRMLGIVALILAFFVQIAGLIVGIIARKKSKAAGYSNGFATAAIWISIVLMVLGLLLAIALIAGGAALFSGISETCTELGSGTFEVDGVTYECP
ncbi:MAG: DUF4190 domain-containing protein [Microcella sp.]|uniref:DUF4190 domain-containing protein n=1 Tax=Microcella sp. TaxID=1913979 RepID=UPI00271FBC93|nr:DUF4190 domain-containing protein [Microcella sp.]MDO8336726.1 DUF4190 domain-containing protein [Microcella sp.]